MSVQLLGYSERGMINALCADMVHSSAPKSAVSTFLSWFHFHADSKPDFTKIASATQRWDLTTRKVLKEWLHGGGCAVSRDGRWLVFIDRSDANVLHREDLASGESTVVVRATQPIARLALDPEGRFLAYQEHQAPNIQLVDLDSDTLFPPAALLATQFLQDLVLAPDEPRLMYITNWKNDTLVAWNITRGEEVWRRRVTSASAVSLSSDDRGVLAASDQGPHSTLFSRADGQSKAVPLVRRLIHPLPSGWLTAASSAVERLSGDQYVVQRYDWQKWQITVISAHLPSGTLLVGDATGRIHGMPLWDDARFPQALTQTDWQPHIAFSSDGTQVAVVVGSRIRLLDATSGRQVGDHALSGHCLGMVNDEESGNRVAATAVGSVEEWSPAGSKVHHYEVGRPARGPFLEERPPSSATAWRQ